ncbi:thioredoxin family protein [Streptomyces sp. NPDC047130]|uniref:TlpA family protein disulfide reductase n=1 Tax=Streptomyces sp. NPDC047130 TaxID=3155261 RepID=UPI0033F479D3
MSGRHDGPRNDTDVPGADGLGADVLGADVPGAGVLGGRAGARATLLQFSTAFCAPCRATRRVLAEVAAMVPGVTHVEVDAEAHLALVRALEVESTPTTLVLDAERRVVRRAAGVPRKADVIAALGEAISLGEAT